MFYLDGHNGSIVKRPPDAGCFTGRKGWYAVCRVLGGFLQVRKANSVETCLHGGRRGVAGQVGKVDGGPPAHVVQELQIHLLEEVLQSMRALSDSRQTFPISLRWTRG